MKARGRSLPRGRCDARRARIVYASARPDKIYGPNSDRYESEEARPDPSVIIAVHTTAEGITGNRAVW